MDPILLSLDLTDVSFGMLLQVVAVIIIFYTAWKKIKELINDFNVDHERKKKWDDTAKKMEEKSPIWDDAVADIRGERKFIIDRYDSQLADIKREITDNHCDTEAKIQEVRSDVIILAESIRAVLEGLIEQGCNGPVKEAKEKLDHYLISSLGR